MKRELLAFCLTPGNVDDRHPVPKLVTGLTGSLFVNQVAGLNVYCHLPKKPSLGLQLLALPVA